MGTPNPVEALEYSIVVCVWVPMESTDRVS
jgi:hypothetical protein